MVRPNLTLTLRDINDLLTTERKILRAVKVEQNGQRSRMNHEIEKKIKENQYLRESNCRE